MIPKSWTPVKFYPQDLLRTKPLRLALTIKGYIPQSCREINVQDVHSATRGNPQADLKLYNRTTNFDEHLGLKIALSSKMKRKEKNLAVEVAHLDII